MKSGLINVSDRPVAQVELISSVGGGRTAKLYTADGVMLCQHAFDGDDELGYAIGLALYSGYTSGYLNAEINARIAIEKALRENSPTKV